jgi:hypothetical protein
MNKYRKRYDTKYYQTHKKAINERNKKWAKEHPDFFKRYREDNIDRYRDIGSKYRKLHKKEISAKNKRWSENNPEKRRCHSVVAYAIKMGTLVRLPCFICGNPKTQAHHPDYTQPLNVIFLCHKHHWEVHHTH